MFNVIICSKEYIEGIKNNCSHIYEMILKDPDIAFCEWDPSAFDFENALPDLKNVISGKAHWRAIVVQDSETFGYETIDRRNPFDAVGSLKSLYDFNDAELIKDIEGLSSHYSEEGVEKWDQMIHSDDEIWNDIDAMVEKTADVILDYRSKKTENYLQATKNPVTKLGMWLFGPPAHSMPEYPELWPAQYSDDTTPLDREYFCTLSDKKILVTEMEQYYSMVNRHHAIRLNFGEGSMLENRPVTMTVISERVASRADEAFKTSKHLHEELEYSNFCDDNLYVDKMRFMFYDVRYDNRVRSSADYFAFISFVFVYAQNELPDGTLSAFHVYKGKAVVERRNIQRLFSRYLSKLELTKYKITNMMIHQRNIKNRDNLPADVPKEVYESDVSIAVVIRNAPPSGEFDISDKFVGLSSNCPKDEKAVWSNESHTLKKKFIRYLREPRRALKSAVNNGFRTNKELNDERINVLDEDQLDDAEIRLYEEEYKMIETRTESLYNTEAFTDEINDADKEVRTAMSRRMTKKKTVIAALIGLGAYLIGFLSLIFSNIGHVGNFLMSLIVIGISLGLLAIIGFIYLFVLKKRLTDRIRHFNMVVAGIMQRIDDMLEAFSSYLSHASNVMRQFSIFKVLKKRDDMKLNILKKHLRDVNLKINEVNEMFVACDIAFDPTANDVLPYDYDYTVLKDYSYDIPYNDDVNESLEYVVKGNNIMVPVDYIKKITVTREELYD